MREGKIVRIQDYTDQATALQAAGCPPARKGSRDNLARSACRTWADSSWQETLLRGDPLATSP